MYTSSQLLPMQNVLVFHYKFYCTCCVIVSYIILYVFRYKQQSVICISNPNCKLKKNIKKYVEIKSTLTVSFLKLKEFNTMK